ncbi:polyglutamine-binding protein 1 [Cylas formicarius]|uniref:polyglutamine-binding protein 1 n=1 Tax=Cylas formicarius TaxID=197179 RepID=UPI0029588282|nr:polyglutamine-binding protein 1 [Cylas formicarius]
MPIPPALAAKLSQRGILTGKQKPEPNKKKDYKGVSTCPNKYNIYHECNHWCEINWKGVQTPDPKYIRNIQKMLVIYPLPNNWMEIFDKGVGRYYYWNMENDLVCWLPPKHPKAQIVRSSAKLREKQQKSEMGEVERRQKEGRKQCDSDRDSDDDDENRTHRRYSDRRNRDDRRSKREKEERHRNSKRPKWDDNALDPMDPAAYSDVPQGTWSDGLDSNKTRADSTASGVLYQQRPYPAPGAVLAANKEKDKDKSRK